MPNMDPQMMRNNINMMKGMNPAQFDNLKNTVKFEFCFYSQIQAKNFQPPGGAASSSTTSNQDAYKRQASAPVSDPKPLSKYSRVENLKANGNDFFKKEQYDQAGDAYFEVFIVQRLNIEILKGYH